MAPPVAVYVVAAVVGAAALFAFKEVRLYSLDPLCVDATRALTRPPSALYFTFQFVYEPQLAPKIEAWAEEFLERRRAARNGRASAVRVSSSRRHRDSTSSSGSSQHDDTNLEDRGGHNRARGPNELPIDEFELEALAAREVDEWRNEVLRSQGRPRDGLRRRRLDRPKDDLGSFDSSSTTLDEVSTRPDRFCALTYSHKLSVVHFSYAHPACIRDLKHLFASHIRHCVSTSNTVSSPPI